MVINTMEDIRNRIINVLSILSNELDKDDREQGWTDDSRKRWHEYYFNLDERIKKGWILSSDAYSIARGLDSDGIHGGALAKEACVISNHLVELSKSGIIKIKK